MDNGYIVAKLQEYFIRYNHNHETVSPIGNLQVKSHITQEEINVDIISVGNDNAFAVFVYGDEDYGCATVKANGHPIHTDFMQFVQKPDFITDSTLGLYNYISTIINTMKERN